MTRQFVCAFNRDRDGYQVPLALAEAGALAVLVTDYYEGASRLRIPQLRHRQVAGIEPAMAVPAYRALAAQVGVELLKKRFSRVPFPADYIDEAIARKAAEQVNSHEDADLFIYSSYAGRAFAAAPDRRRILFQFHPGESAVRAALGSPTDFPGKVDWIAEPELHSKRRRDNYDLEISQATQFLVASSFTKRGLVQDGVDGSRVTVVPYGCPPVLGGYVPATERTLLFLGQGVQRKGLHLLLKAWSSMPHEGFRLLVVSNFIDPAMQPLIHACSDLEVRRGVGDDEVKHLMASADTLVLPSLVEGFGLVLGEALAAGCRLIATPHTGLPDLGLPPEDATLVTAGMVSELRSALVAHMQSHEAGPDRRRSRQQHAKRLSWEAFRHGVRQSVGLTAQDSRGAAPDGGEGGHG